MPTTLPFTHTLPPFTLTIILVETWVDQPFSRDSIVMPVMPQRLLGESTVLIFFLILILPTTPYLWLFLVIMLFLRISHK